MDFIKSLELPEANFIRFKEQIQQFPLSRLEEIYTQTFDLQAICYPYAGYQLFGEDYRRGEFMVKLKEHYRSAGFEAPGDELPDHIGVIFKYLAWNPEDKIIIEECLIPVFEKLLKSFRENTDNPYYFLLKGIYESIKSEKEEKIEERVEDLISVRGG